jgi:hypothetical protein
MASPRKAPAQPSLPSPLHVLVVCPDPERRADIEQQCRAAAPHASVECVSDVSSAIFRLASKSIQLAILDEASLGPLPVGLEGMMKSLGHRIALLTVATAATTSRNTVDADGVATWMASYCASRPRS